MHQRWIAGSTTRGDHLALRFALESGGESVDTEGDGRRRERGQGREQILLPKPCCIFKPCSSDIGTELLPTGRFGGGLLEIPMLQPLLQKLFLHAPFGCHRAVLIAASAAICEELDCGIKHHVAGAGVERDHVFRSTVRRKHGDVRDAADVQDDALQLAVAEREKIEERDEWRAASTYRHVGLPEVAHRRRLGKLRNTAAVPKLPRCRQLLACVCRRLALMEDGLPVASDKVGALDARLFTRSLDGLCILE